ncbi:hypothetical protein AB0I10_17625 [Streptomyces sp. NPDC050636]|uniref:hypothetical protein n=1 Tax=Streptomyces sp. NPDC050636 TaxID=3154510 RepID=UPI003415C72E
MHAGGVAGRQVVGAAFDVEEDAALPYADLRRAAVPVDGGGRESGRGVQRDTVPDGVHAAVGDAVVLQEARRQVGPRYLEPLPIVRRPRGQSHVVQRAAALTARRHR